MAIKTDSWRAKDGTLHPNDRSATEYDLGLLAIKMSGANPHAAKLADLLAEHAEEIVIVCGAYANCHKRASRSNESEPGKRQKGPVKRDPPPQRGD